MDVLGVSDKLRARLLDLTKRNRMLNHAMGPRARRQVQFVGTDLQTAYDAIVADKAAVAVAPLDEPDTLSADERTADFADALAQARVSDIEYLVAREGLTATANDGDPAVERLERSLRDRLRERSGMSPRQARLDVGRVEHARALGIDPEAEFKRAADRPPRVGPLQTLRYPAHRAKYRDQVSQMSELLLSDADLDEAFHPKMEWLISKKLFGLLFLNVPGKDEFTMLVSQLASAAADRRRRCPREA